MKKSLVMVLLLFVAVAGALVFLTTGPRAAPQCVDPDFCPDIICPPNHVFVPTTCEECGHCEPGNDGPLGEGPGGGRPGGGPPGGGRP